MDVGCHLSSIAVRAPETDTGPYALTNFLPAGTLALAAPSAASSCNSHHAAGWHHWPGTSELTDNAQSEQTSISRLLDFLIHHEFIVASCRIESAAELYVRIYLVPFDLRNVEGRLRRRDETTVLNPARKYMRALLSRLTRDVDSWNGHSCAATRAPFFIDDDVSKDDLCYI